MLIYAPRAEPKRRARRSRTGCTQCKVKKVKCNEQRPRCGRCAERKTTCEYKTDIWPSYRSFDTIQKSSNHREIGSEPLASPEPTTPLSQDGRASLQRRISTLSDQLSPAGSDDNESAIDMCDDSSESQMSSSAVLVLSKSNRTLSSQSMSPRYELNIPIFSEISQPHNRRALLNHFTSELSTLMTFSADAGNPFRELVLPMCESSQPLLYAVLALSCAHLEFKGVDNKEESINLHTQALHSLSEALSRQERGHELVTAIIMLIYYEVLVHRGKSNTVQSNIVHGHLKAALSIIKPLAEDDSPLNKFLSLVLYFHDVIAALSTGTAAQSLTPRFQAITLDLSDHPPSPTVDAVLGMTTELWPIIHDISHVMKMRKEVEAVESLGFADAAAALRAESDRRSEAIRVRLKDWAPIKGLKSDGTSTPNTDRVIKTDHRVQSVICNAEAYHHAAFVYFYRNLQSLPRRSPLVQYHAKEALSACLRVVMFEGPMAALLWPLFVGACEAVKEVDREIARTVFRATMNKQGFVNIAQSWDVVQEVWRAADEDSREVSWEEIGAAQGLLVFA